MIPAIGYMIGCYILTRMAQIFFATPSERRPWPVAALAVITVVVTVVCLAALLSAEGDVASSLKHFGR
jgi:hypothetical protein